MFEKKLKIVVYDATHCEWRETTVPYTFRFQWTADMMWRTLEGVRRAHGFNRWYHMIVDINFDCENPYARGFGSDGR